MAVNLNGAFYPGIGDTQAYVGRTGDPNARSYLYKGAGHMVFTPQYEPQRVNNFEVVIENLDILATADTVGTATNYVQPKTGDRGVLNPPNAAERIMLSVDSYSAPTIDIAQITTQYGNNSIKWAGKPEFPNSTLVINDYIGLQTERILAAWFRCAYDFKSEKIGLARDYKKVAHLIEYDPKGGSARTWRLDGVWLASFNLGDWNQAGNAQRQVNATLVYDRVVPDYGLEDSNSWGGIKVYEAGQALRANYMDANRAYQNTQGNP